MKKIISAFLTAVLLFGMITVPALAGQEKIEKNTIAQQLIVDFLGWNQVQEELICTVSQDLELLKVVGLDALVKIDKVDNDGSVTYKIQFEDSGVVDYLKVEKDAEENIVLRVRENELQNELIYTSNKKIYLDGYEVENQENISRVLDEYIRMLIQARYDVDHHEANAIYQMFESSRDYRDSIDVVDNGLTRKAYVLYLDLADEAGGIATITTILAMDNISIKNIRIGFKRYSSTCSSLITFINNMKFFYSMATVFKSNKINFTIFINFYLDPFTQSINNTCTNSMKTT